MAGPSCIPYDAAWRFDNVVPVEDQTLSYLSEGLDIDMDDRMEGFSPHGSLHDMHDYIDPLPYVDFRASPQESFYATSRRPSACSVSKSDEMTEMTSNIRFVSPTQPRDRRASIEMSSSNIARSRNQRQKRPRIEREGIDSRPHLPSSSCQEKRTKRLIPKAEKKIESDNSSRDEDQKSSLYPALEHARHFDYPAERHHHHYYPHCHDPRMVPYSPHAEHINRERMLAFMHRSEETRAQILMHLRSFPTNSARFRANVENFHSTRVSSDRLYHNLRMHYELDHYYV
jgi:hypothetical protein